jgi:hypothetical protein
LEERKNEIVKIDLAQQKKFHLLREWLNSTAAAEQELD